MTQSPLSHFNVQVLLLMAFKMLSGCEISWHGMHWVREEAVGLAWWDAIPTGAQHL